MLATLREEKAQLERRLETLEEREETLLSWLKEEQPSQGQLPAMTSGANGGTPLSVFLRGALGDGRPHTLQDLVTQVKGKGGLIREEASPGRVVHYALIGMQQHGYVKRSNDGTWAAKK